MGSRETTGWRWGDTEETRYDPRARPGHGGGIRWAAGAGVTLTGLVAHAAQDRPHLHAEVPLPLLQTLAHQRHHLIRGEVPSVCGKERRGPETKAGIKDRGWDGRGRRERKEGSSRRSPRPH